MLSPFRRRREVRREWLAGVIASATQGGTRDYVEWAITLRRWPSRLTRSDLLVFEIFQGQGYELVEQLRATRLVENGDTDSGRQLHNVREEQQIILRFRRSNPAN